MSTDLMTDDDRWAAVLRRDRALDGRFVTGVLTTGIYCRPSCAARHPLQASSRGKPQHAVRVAGDREGRNGPSGNKAHAQAQPGGALGIDEVAFGYAGGFNQRLSVGLQRDHKTRIGHFDDDHVGRRVR